MITIDEWVTSRLKNIFFVMILCFFPILTCAANQTKITSIRLFPTDYSTRIIFNLSNPTSVQFFSLENPNRLVLDFNHSQLTFRLNMLRLIPPPLKSIRSGRPETDKLRIVIDMNTPFTFKQLVQIDSRQLVFDIYPKKTFYKKTSGSIPKTKIKPFIVVIDPGHGGKDTGAIGTFKTREKDIVLSIATQLANLINQQPNMRAVMTRQGDYFVTLANRLVLARKGDADLFVAVHADSYFNNRASGASVFALSLRGATTVAAKWLSDSDNHSELGDVELNHLSDQSYLLRSVLIDLAQTATIRDSLRLGNSILDTLEDITKLHSLRVEQAPFMVLKSPDIPSVLVETGFVSNKMEELRLRDKSYQHKIALAIFNGIRLYQKKYAP